MGKKIRLVTDYDSFELHGAVRVQSALARQGFDCSIAEAHRLWEAFSESMCAGWMHIPNDDDEVLASVRAYFEVEGE